MIMYFYKSYHIKLYILVAMATIVEHVMIFSVADKVL